MCVRFTGLLFPETGYTTWRSVAETRREGEDIEPETKFHQLVWETKVRHAGKKKRRLENNFYLLI